MVFFGHTLVVRADSPAWMKALKSIPGLGVPLFFALSAYLVTELLRAEKAFTGSIKVGAFYSRRVLRIWPLYFFVLGMGFVLSRLYPDTPISWFALLCYTLLMGNWYTSRYGFLSFSLGPLWSIPVEEQFYFSWPWIARTVSRPVLALICLAGWLCSQTMLLYLCYHHASSSPEVWTNSIVQLQYFAIGAGMSIWLNGSVPKIGVPLRLLFVVGGFLLSPLGEYLGNANAILGERSSITHLYPTYLVGGVSVTAMLIGFLGCTALANWSAVRYLGKISYGLYLFHPLAIVQSEYILHNLGLDSPGISTPAALLIDIGIAWLSYEYLEKPFLRLKERFAVVKSRAV